GHRGAGPRRDAGGAGRPPGLGLAGRAGRAARRPGPRPAARIVRLDRRHGARRCDSLPADHVRPARRAGRRARRGPGQARSRGPRCAWRADYAAALRTAEPAVRAVLEPDGLPAAVDRMGGAPGDRASLTRNAEDLLIVV